VRRLNWTIIALLISALLLPQQALAQRFPERWQGPRVRPPVVSPGPSRSLDNVVRRIRKETNGRVLSAETRTIEGRRIHVIRILTGDGRVRRLRVDADSGRRLPRR